MGFITDILKEIPLSAVLKERLADAESKYGVLQAESQVLKRDNADLRQLIEKQEAEISDLKKKVEILTKPVAQPRWGSQPRIGTPKGF